MAATLTFAEATPAILRIERTRARHDHDASRALLPSLGFSVDAITMDLPL